MSLRHTHGTADTVVPMAGRPIGSSRQGDIETGFARWRAANGCALSWTRWSPRSETARSDSVLRGKELKLCTHPGKHTKPDGFCREPWSGPRPSEPLIRPQTIAGGSQNSSPSTSAHANAKPTSLKNTLSGRLRWSGRPSKVATVPPCSIIRATAARSQMAQPLRDALVALA